MKTLKELLRNTPVTALHGDDSAAVAGLVYDSRAVGPGDCFFAVRGTQNDGHDFIPAAVAKGAAAVVCERLPEQTAADVVYVAVPDAAGALADMAAAVFCTITRPFLSSALVSAKASFESESKKSFLARMYSAKVLW